MLPIATTPEPPYYAAIFTSRLSRDHDGYAQMAYRMVQLAEKQPGFLGIETASAGLQITVSYWRDLAAIRAWKENAEHQVAQKMGRDRWYERFCIRICRVEREYGMGGKPDEAAIG